MSSGEPARPFDLIERTSLWLSAFCLIGMTGLMLLEVVLRGALNSTTEHSDELVGYLLIGVSFLSLALCQSRGAFHRVEMVRHAPSVADYRATSPGDGGGDPQMR